jgi:hypothetical protein
MRKMASIGFAIAALSVTALPVHADDQSIGFATGAIGGTPLPLQADEQQPQTTSRQRSADWRAAPSQQMSAEAYRGYAQSGEYTQKSCSYIGGPKGSVGWTC